MNTVVIRGAGEMATGTAHRLFKSGYRIIMSELPKPLAVRRTVAFAQAVFDDTCTVEGVSGQRTSSLEKAVALTAQGKVAVYVGKIRGADLRALKPIALVDATMAKENLGTSIDEAPVVIALGPGFVAGVDAHAVIETNRGHDLGRALYSGSPQANTSDPGDICGFTRERVVKFSQAGVFYSNIQIGDDILAGQEFGRIDDEPILAAVGGVVRGVLRSGIWVPAGTKLGDIDPRGRQEYCYTISDKARAIAGGVLEALLCLGRGDGR